MVALVPAFVPALVVASQSYTVASVASDEYTRDARAVTVGAAFDAAGAAKYAAVRVAKAKEGAAKYAAVRVATAAFAVTVASTSLPALVAPGDTGLSEEYTLLVAELLLLSTVVRLLEFLGLLLLLLLNCKHLGIP